MTEGSVTMKNVSTLPLGVASTPQGSKANDSFVAVCSQIVDACQRHASTVAPVNRAT